MTPLHPHLKFRSNCLFRGDSRIFWSRFCHAAEESRCPRRSDPLPLPLPLLSTETLSIATLSRTDFKLKTHAWQTEIDKKDICCWHSIFKTFQKNCLFFETFLYWSFWFSFVKCKFFQVRFKWGGFNSSMLFWKRWMVNSVLRFSYWHVFSDSL